SHPTVPVASSADLPDVLLTKKRSAKGAGPWEHAPARLSDAGGLVAHQTTSTGPIREFHYFMERHLRPKRLKELDAELQAAGHEGTPEHCRFEHWLLTRDPIKALAEEFTVSDLRRFVREKTGKQPARGASTEQLAQELLGSLGFAIPREPL